MKKTNVLIIDDDTLFCDAVMLAKPEGMTFYAAHTAEQGMKKCREQVMGVVILDQNLPDGNGSDLCPDILKLNETCKIIFASAYPKLETAVKAVKFGAFDYLIKPFSMDELLLVLDRAIRYSDLEKAEELSSRKNERQANRAVFLGKSDPAQKVRREVALSAESRASVLLTGDTGTGKSHLAQCIHYQGTDSESPFIAVNCGALAENLIESELFGHEKGSFTGASKMRRGVFELADTGTLFLDEIGTLLPHLQVKLLGVLDNGKVTRIGGSRERQVDVRIIAATNMNLTQAVAEAAFREDLFYRLSVLHIHMPPLVERLEDIEELSAFFLGTHDPLPRSEIMRLMQYNWPGNVRELRNIIERSLILHKPGPFKPSQLVKTSSRNSRSGSRIASGATESPQIPAEQLPSLAEKEKEYIYTVLEQVGHNNSTAARILGISRSTLQRKIKQYCAGQQ